MRSSSATAIALLAWISLQSCVESFSIRDASAPRCALDGGGCGPGERCITSGHGLTCACVEGHARLGERCWSLPRPLAPMSTSLVTAHRPTLRWTSTEGGEVRVSLCRDRAMSRECYTFDAGAERGAPPRPLTPGVWFWRITRRVRDEVALEAGPVWQFSVGVRSAPTDLAWGSTLDVNGDGYADLAVGTESSGTAYLFLGGPERSTLGDHPLALTVPAGQSSAVASAGDVNGDGVCDFIVGSPNSNTAYLYLGSEDSPPLRNPPQVIAGPAGSASFGNSVAGVGDVDGDGYGDVLVGAFRSNTAYLYFGQPGTTSLRPTPRSFTGPEGSVTFGNVVAGIGDVNGDGIVDLGIGGYVADRAYVYLGTGGSAAVREPPITLEGPVDSRFGGAVAGADDVNGDGYADLVVGAHNYNRVYVFLGAHGVAALQGDPIVFDGPSGSSAFGGCDGAGDVNGDGYADMIGAGPGFNLVQLHLGGEDDTALRATPTVIRGPVGSGYFGAHVAGAGDLDGDGYGDFIVGAFTSSSAFVYFGRGGRPPADPSPVTLSGPPGSRFGVWVAHSSGISRRPGAIGCGRGARDGRLGAPSGGASGRRDATRVGAVGAVGAARRSL